MANVKDLLVNGSARVIGTIYGNATSANKVNHSLTFGSKSFNGSSAQTITLADLGGKPTQSAVSSPSASGTEISFIDTISQNANGVITTTKKTVRDASASQSGVVNTGAQSFKGNKTLDDGMLIIKPAGRSSWQEGIRILSANNGWTTIALGGSATSGTNASIWSMHTYQSNFYLAHNGSSSSSTGLLQSDASGNWRIDNTLGIGGKDTNYKLYVNGISYFTNYLQTTSYFKSTVATGTSPIQVSSTTLNANLNADLLDGYHESSFLRYRDTVSGSGGASHSNSLWSQIGIRQYNSALPDAMADSATYTWGAVISLPGANARLDIWYNHQTSTNGNGLRYRTGWDNDKRAWATILDSVNYGTIADGRYVLKSGDTMTGNLQIQKNTPELIFHNTASDSYSIIRMGELNKNKAVIFINSSSRTDDGGANVLTIRNDTGAGIRLDSDTRATRYLTVGQQALNTSATLYVNGTGFFNNKVTITTNAQPQLTINGTTGNWAYIKLHNGNNFWDIASHSNNISGSLQLRANGGDTNRAIFNTNGRLDLYSTQGPTNTIRIISNNAESSICYSGGDYTAWTVGRSPGAQDSRFGWWNGSRNVMWLEHTGILHIGTAKNYNELRIHGAFDASGTGIQDGADRPSLKITGNYPQLVIMGGGVSNASHGSTLAIGAWDVADATSGNFKTWTFGTPGYNATWMDLAYNINGTNPHNGINNWTQNGTAHHRLIRFKGDTQQLLVYGTGNDKQPPLQSNSSRDGSWVYNAGFLAPNLTANHNNFIVLGKDMSTRNSFGFTHMHIADGSVNNYGAVEIFGVGNAQRWYYDRHSAFMARLDVANQANDKNYMHSALQIREYNYGGAQSDTWAIAPRLSWYWSGRVQTQIGLASDGELYLSKNNFANAYRLVYETGTWGININGNAATATIADKLATIVNLAGNSTNASVYWNPFTWEINYAWGGCTGIYTLSDSENVFNGIFSVKLRNGNSGVTLGNALVTWLSSSTTTPPTLTLTTTVNSASITYKLFITAPGAYRTYRISKITEIGIAPTINTGLITEITGTIQSSANTTTTTTATKLATARTISLTGSVTGSGTFDGSGNLSISTTTNHTHNYAGSASAGGSANSAVKLDTAAAGDSNTPVYFSGGKPVACTSLDLNTSGTAAGLSSVIANDKLPPRLRVNTSPTNASIDSFKQSGFWYAATSGISNVGDVNVISINHTDGGWGHQLAFKFNGAGVSGTAYDGADIYTRLYNSSKAAWTPWHTILSSGNFNKFAPTLTGTGASGTWGINITGGATSSSKLAINNTKGLSDCLQYLQASFPSGDIDSPDSSWYHVLKFNHGNGDTYYKRLMAFSFWGRNNVYTATAEGNGTTSAWSKFWLQGDSVTGAVWNDYAEYREADTIQGGRCVREVGDDTLALTTKRLMRGCSITSDTWGFAQGETDKAKTPIAVAGRVLAYPLEDRELFREYIGYSVCSGPDGTVSLMTEEEELKYPWAIVGTVSAVPDYEEWGGGEMADRPSVKVNGRIWIKIK